MCTKGRNLLPSLASIDGLGLIVMLLFITRNHIVTNIKIVCCGASEINPLYIDSIDSHAKT